MELLKMPNVTYCEFKKGSTIIRQGENIEYLYYLVNGICYRKVTTEKGDEIIIGIKEANQFIYSLMGVLVVLGNGVSDAQFVAKTKCCCYKIPKKSFLSFIVDKPDILLQLVEMASVEYLKLSLLFQTRQKGKSGNLFCRFLLGNAKNRNNRIFTDKTYSNVELSCMLGIHKVTAAKIIKKLKEEGIINKCKDGIEIVDREQLIKYANFECDLKY